MKQSAITMGMPVTVSIVDKNAKSKDIEEVFAYLKHIDEVFSTYKSTSEISRINDNLLSVEDASKEVQHVFVLCEETKKETNGYFDMEKDGKIDPSGIVKGYAIHEAAEMLRKKGYKHFFVEIAGDVEVSGKNENGENWKVGIENPFNRQEIIKVIHITDAGVATSGNYIRGKHIYDPVHKKDADDITSLSVIGPNVYEADRFATAAFAMGEKSIEFIEQLPGFEGYMVLKNRQAIYTSGMDRYTIKE